MIALAALFLAVAFLLALRSVLPIVSRLVRVVERRTELAEQMVAKREQRDPIPLDLLHACLQESQPWAREERLKRLLELYEESGNWDRVRSAEALLGNHDIS